ncbi:MAG: class I SAM-dependent methyltransferase [Bacillus sp. (in: Bacteria)]|nr:class I SAM-dependent methyltransferase [Bacillus sp. (in: firmicutes)]
MAFTNKELNEWTLSLLNIRNSDRVLEIGFGPGIAVEKISNVIKEGIIVGIDPSEVMLSQAQKRNEVAISEGKVKLHLAEIENLPVFDETFDKIFSINSIIFWNQPIKRLKDLRKLMKPNGLIAITIQPRSKEANNEIALEEGKKLVQYLKEAGFSQIQLEVKEMKPVLAVCAMDVNPSS